MARTYLAPGWPWYLKDGRLHFGVVEVRNADLSTFRPLGEWWGRDSRRVYCAGSEVRGADVASFRVLNSLYAKDDHRAYTASGPIRDADVTSFVAVGPTEHPFNTTNGYAKDDRAVYHTVSAGKACVLKGADPATFAPRGHGYGADNSAVYFERKKVPGADPAEWRHIRGLHSHSVQKAYALGERIRGADGRSLESLPILGSTGWSRDGKGYYLMEKPSDPGEYFDELRRCFIFIGRVSHVSLTWNQTEPLDPTRTESWAIAGHAWMFVVCKEWVYKPDLEVVEVPRVGEPFKVGQGLHLGLLASRTWMDEDRVWILQPHQDYTTTQPRLLLYGVPVWWEYSSLDQLGSIRTTLAAAGVS
jgi:hypothetical protein